MSATMFDLGPVIAGACASQVPGAGLRAGVDACMAAQGFVLLPPAALQQVCGTDTAACAASAGAWEALPADRYLKDGGHYRSRRHGSFVLDLQGEGASLEQVAHRAHFQPLTYNALHGGLVRWYEPLTPELVAAPWWHPVLANLGRMFARHRGGVERWFIEAHQFRIDTHEGVGRPTPEGAHRDGVDFVAVILVARHGIRGGESRVFELDGPRGVRFTLSQPWGALLLDDTRVIHESTPIMPLDTDNPGWRDTLVLTYRAGGFLDPQPA